MKRILLAATIAALTLTGCASTGDDQPDITRDMFEKDYTWYEDRSFALNVVMAAMPTFKYKDVKLPEDQSDVQRGDLSSAFYLSKGVVDLAAGGLGGFLSGSYLTLWGGGSDSGAKYITSEIITFVEYDPSNPPTQDFLESTMENIIIDAAKKAYPNSADQFVDGRFDIRELTLGTSEKDSPYCNYVFAQLDAMDKEPVCTFHYTKKWIRALRVSKGILELEQDPSKQYLSVVLSSSSQYQALELAAQFNNNTFLFIHNGSKFGVTAPFIYNNGNHYLFIKPRKDGQYLKADPKSFWTVKSAYKGKYKRSAQVGMIDIKPHKL